MTTCGTEKYKEHFSRKSTKATSDEKYVARFQDWNAKTINDNAKKGTN